MNTYIRRTSMADIASLTHLIQTAFRDAAIRFGLTLENCPKHPSNYTEERTTEDLRRGVNYFILESETGPAGCVGLERAEQRTCYLERLAVMPRHRKKGYGKRLVRKVIEEAAWMKVRTVSIGIIAEQTDLRLWYGRIGFVEGETRSFPHLPFRVHFMTYYVTPDDR